MLPEPKDVAKFVRKKLLASKKERFEARELERDSKIRQSKTLIRRNLMKQQELRKRTYLLAKKALRLGDETSFRQLGKQIIWSDGQINRWEKYLLTLEMLEAKRDQVRTSAEMLEAVKAVSDSFDEFVEPNQVKTLQRDIESGLQKASNIEEKVDVMMDVLDEAMENNSSVDNLDVDILRDDLTEKIRTEEAAKFQVNFDEDLERIRKELEKMD